MKLFRIELTTRAFHDSYSECLIAAENKQQVEQMVEHGMFSYSNDTRFGERFRIEDWQKATITEIKAEDYNKVTIIMSNWIGY